MRIDGPDVTEKSVRPVAVLADASQPGASTIDDPPPSCWVAGLTNARTGHGIDSPPSTGCSRLSWWSLPHCQSSVAL